MGLPTQGLAHQNVICWAFATFQPKKFTDGNNFKRKGFTTSSAEQLHAMQLGFAAKQASQSSLTRTFNQQTERVPHNSCSHAMEPAMDEEPPPPPPPPPPPEDDQRASPKSLSNYSCLFDPFWLRGFIPVLFLVMVPEYVVFPVGRLQVTFGPCQPWLFPSFSS